MLPNTLAILEAIEHVGEVARLIFILSRRDFPRMEEAALIEACKRTAGASGRYPRPKPALELAVSMGLVSMHRSTVTLTDTGRTFSATGGQFGLDLSVSQGQLILGALLDDSVVEENFKIFLGNFQPIGRGLVARKNVISPEPGQLLICRLLQQIGALQVSGDYFELVRPFDNIVERLIICSARLSQAELLQRLERQRKRGDLAEQKVVELERHRLTLFKRKDLAARVERISVDDVGAGYDVKSFEGNEAPRFIEVKSSVSSQVMFEWSESERAKASKEREAYYVYFVPYSFTLPKLTAPVIMIRNPITQIENGALLELPSNFKVKETDTRVVSRRVGKNLSPPKRLGDVVDFSSLEPRG